MKGFPHCRLVELRIPGVAGGQQNTVFQFADQPDIRYARVLAIETFTVSDLTKTFPSNLTVIDSPIMITGSLILETNDADDLSGASGSAGRFTSTQQNIKYMPLASLHRIQNSATNPFTRQLMEFDNMYVTWEKSFVQFSAPPANSTDLGLAFLVYYTWMTAALPNNPPKPIKRN